ncbi:hypothetical protein J4434_00775 [Candidatus Woesearchaeota archaeon]|nr:hypothetical protein [Candidatus Woesearchaeota archaeon]
MDKVIIWVKQFSKKKVYYHKDIAELFKYDNISLWWLVEPWLDRDSKYFPSVSDIFYKRNEKIKKTEEIKHRLGTLLMNYSFDLKTRLRKRTIGRNNIYPCNILVTTHPSFLQSGRNVRIGSIIDDLNKQTEINVLYYDDLASFGLKTREQRKRYTFVNPIELFYDYETTKIIQQQRKKFLSLYNRMMKSIDFTSAFIINNENAYHLLKDRLDFVLKKMIGEAIFYIETTKKAIKLMKPKLVIQMSGSTLQGKAITAAAHSLNVPVLEIQEGLIDDTLYYVHSKEDVLRGCPMPDKIAVYGEFTKKKLIGYDGYDEKNIEIVGQPNTDFLFRKIEDKNIENRDPDIYLLKLSGKKIVLYATVADLTKEVALSILSRIVNSFKDKKEFALFIKPHPRDSYISEYVKMIRGVDNVFIKKEFNIYDAITLSDYVVAFSNCTVILEALILNKTVMGLIPKEINNFLPFKPYVDSGAVLLIDNIDNLMTILEDVNNNINLQKKLKEKRNLFVKDQVYKIDGKVNERISDLALDMLKHKYYNKTIKT